MMEYSRSDSVAIDIGTRDGAEEVNLELLHNNIINNNSSSNNNSSNNNRNSTDSSPINDRSASTRGHSVSQRCPSPNPASPGEEIELVDMRSPVRDGEGNLNQGSSHYDAQFPLGPRAGNAGYPEVKVDTGLGTLAEPDSNMKRWAEDVVRKHKEAESLATLASASAPNLARPGSRQSQARASRPSSSLSVHTGLDVRTGSSQSRRHKGAGRSLYADDEDEDISLESLSDLLGTVRQYAREIKEIYAPIQREEEERIKKRTERNAKRKNRAAQNKSATPAGLPVNNPMSQTHHEVRVEIHKMDGDSTRRTTDRPELASHSKSLEPSPSHPVALLHVENEQLASTWPRERQKGFYAQRSRSENSASPDRRRGKGSMKTSHSSSFSRPQIPADWNDEGSVRHERDILNKAFQRLNTKQTGGPLLSAFNKNQGGTHSKFQNDMFQSRESVIQIARDHAKARQTCLPSISIIPPTSTTNPVNPQGSGTGSSVFGNDVLIPSGHVVCEDGRNSRGKETRRSKNGNSGVKSSSRMELRRRKSVDQGLGQNEVLEKY